MSMLIVEHIEATPLIQKYRISKNLSLAGVRCYLVLTDRPDGLITLNIKSSSTLLGSKSITLSEVTNPLAKDHSHGFLFFELDQAVRLNHLPTQEWTEYTLELEHTGSTRGSVAWVKDYTGKAETYPASNPRDLDTPYTFQLIEWK